MEMKQHTIISIKKFHFKEKHDVLMSQQQQPLLPLLKNTRIEFEALCSKYWRNMLHSVLFLQRQLINDA
ncbi:CLUMA_CG016102, isoform A [Clunio marinus]|uniref:CLUMA_CG016102, isoform A n=1 Tax=Clunio marinus TaxID=568069 RepID=A0A1J1IR20_9DIPT|nr:CLUMA_CG016102, isoform A [Clunio marinus]